MKHCARCFAVEFGWLYNISAIVDVLAAMVQNLNNVLDRLYLVRFEGN